MHYQIDEIVETVWNERFGSGVGLRRVERRSNRELLHSCDLEKIRDPIKNFDTSIFICKIMLIWSRNAFSILVKDENFQNIITRLSLSVASN